MQTSRVLGLAWYRVEDFADIRQMMEDRDAMHGSHADWLLAAEQIEQRRRASGFMVYRAPLFPKMFRMWCHVRGLRPDAGARNEFAAEFARSAHRTERRQIAASARCPAEV